MVMPKPDITRTGRHRAVFLDRDGVINRSVIRDGKPYPPASLAEFTILPDVADGLVRLRNAGYLLIVVTNQPDVRTGVQSREVVEDMHRMLRRVLPVDDIRMCCHVDSDNCDCRKPKPGMILSAARDWSIDLLSSHLVGDRWRDIEAGKAVGCRTYFIDYNLAEQRPPAPDAVVASLSHAADIILSCSP
jgi:D-glycero-D-manno-heptose 1,7-bisphosphate phosphatase